MSRTVHQYQSVAAGSTKSLNKRVNELMTSTKTPDTQEWTPKGGISICFNENSIKYAQAMVLVDLSDD